MATSDIDIEKTLHQLIEKLSQTDQFLDQLDKECDSKGSTVLEKKQAVEQLNTSQLDLKEEFYNLLAPSFQSDGDDFHYLDLSELQDQISWVIGTKGKDELVRLTQGLEGFKKSIDGSKERALELMRDLNIEPRFSDVNEMFNRKRPFHLTDFAQEVGEKESEGVEGKESGVSSVSDVAIHMYGFAADIAADIKDSLLCRKLIKNEMLIDRDEAAVKLDNKDSHEDRLRQSDLVELSWFRVKKLKRKLEELKKKMYTKQEVDVNDEKKILGGAGDEDPSSLRVTFLTVIRHWIFHIESVLFNFIMYELYYMLPGIEAAETIFEDYKAKLKNLMEINHGLVPIIVYKIIYMMENPIEIIVNENGEAIRKPSVYGSGRRTLHEKIELDDVMEQVHKIILRLRSVLATSSLSYTHLVREAESVAYETMLNKAEDEVREIQRKINWAKSELKTNPFT